MHETFSAHLLAENYNSKLNKTMATDRESEPAQKSKNKRIPISNHQSMMPRVRKPSLRFLWPWMAKAKRTWVRQAIMKQSFMRSRTTAIY